MASCKSRARTGFLSSVMTLTRPFAKPWSLTAQLLILLAPSTAAWSVGRLPVLLTPIMSAARTGLPRLTFVRAVGIFEVLGIRDTTRPPCSCPVARLAYVVVPPSGSVSFCDNRKFGGRLGPTRRKIQVGNGNRRTRQMAAISRWQLHGLADRRSLIPGCLPG